MTFEIENHSDFLSKALVHASSCFEYVFYLENNGKSYPNNAFPKVLALGNKILDIQNISVFEALKEGQNESSIPLFVALSYDLKNEIEELESNNNDYIHFPVAVILKPSVVVYLSQNQVTIEAEHINPAQFFNEIIDLKKNKKVQSFGEIKTRFSKEEYLQTVKNIQKDIQRGDIYELNFCMEYFIQKADIEPVNLFLNLIKISPMPFSAFVKAKDKFLLCASPERFLKKSGEKLISQPIKGTSRRGENEIDDKILKQNLANSDKEKAENVMIVDLVRNDLSHTAKDGSVVVEELCKVYTFEQVHQMISTVSAIQSKNFHFTETIKNCFPMGSMTGAPKVNAMKLIEKYEKTKRGMFSGSVGIIYPNQDFDLNVVIRSIIYNSDNQYLSFQVGSAITIDAQPEKEWEECEIKIAAIKQILK